MHDKSTFGAALVAMAASLVACHPNADLSAPVEPVATTEQPTAQAPTKSEDYRLVVRFISIGEGTDSDASEELTEMITDRRLAVETLRWGREGEHTACLRLDELDDAGRSEFVSDVKQAFVANGLIAIEENTTCRW